MCYSSASFKYRTATAREQRSPAFHIQGQEQASLAPYLATAQKASAHAKASETQNLRAPEFCSDAGDQERYQTWRCLHLKDWEELLARVLCKDKI
ncbi:hypothetical protein Y1Q_0023657 [Alligator mississippiensis]|uniref:Uncharacterized protein n=1 Tax=Alligator mississippiensis TaxID=8496 RepID=A0A151MN79_ALLMI|nr:hypothetical protein Y1Q_0023657 [Alligator mississippiensis]